MGLLLNKEQILSADDMGYEDVSCPEWGGDVRIKKMTGRERDLFDASCMGNGKGKDRSINYANIRSRLVVRTAVDESGNRLFADSDAEALGEKSAVSLDLCADVAQRLNKIGVEDIEALAKN